MDVQSSDKKITLGWYLDVALDIAKGLDAALNRAVNTVSVGFGS
jgi:hypothetical protein